MLRRLELENVGPAPRMALDLAERLNLITGDNGLGKSFLLDVAWWALTRRWPREVNPRLTSGYRAEPRDPKQPARITFTVDAVTGPKTYTSAYVPRDEAWEGRAGRPLNPGLVVYAHSDGAFSVWDPARNYWRTREGVDVQERRPAYVFSPHEVWHGLPPDAAGNVGSNGLLADLSRWQTEQGEQSNLMRLVLAGLSPDFAEEDLLKLGPIGRLSVDDARPVPTIGTDRTGYALIVHASAGIRRIAALGYMLLWTWQQHQEAAKKLGESPTTRITVLVDEIETHLHPRWQRSILRSLLSITEDLSWQGTAIQFVTTTHSPLVLASTEPFFDDTKDAWFDLDLERDGGTSFARLRRRDYVRHGDVTNWLTSEAFDLESGYSREAGEALQQAMALARQPGAPAPEELARVDALVRRARLPETDAFAARWELYVRQHGAAK